MNDSLISIILQQIKQPLWENWYIKEKIGSGAFGAVYRAEAKRQNRIDISALKIEPVVADGQMISDEEKKKIYLENRRKMIENES
ncbi:MAG: hypothetical protein K2J08_00705, partial [Ruminococcus sp.]|nr:hypothetical protein [Ruminococcus sp.]